MVDFLDYINKPAKVLSKLVVLATLFSISINDNTHANTQNNTIENITISGNQRVEPNTVVSYTGLSKGESASYEKINQAVKKLYQTGLFADVKAKLDGNNLILALTENPIINEVKFEGNDKLDSDELLQELKLKSRSTYSEDSLKKDVARISDLYRKSGRYGVQVKPNLQDLGDNRVNLIYKVTEGEKSIIEDINFVGNKYFSDGDLRAVISSSEGAWYKFLSSSDVYDEDRIQYDKELLKASANWYKRS